MNKLAFNENECTESLIERIRPLAAEFRRGIEPADKTNWPRRALDFPRGCCGPVSLLLGTYLDDLGIHGSTSVAGTAIDPIAGDDTHGWLEIEGVLADITGGQFGDIHEPVIVTDRDYWHGVFIANQRKEATYRSLGTFHLNFYYWDIIRAIDPNHRLLERRDGSPKNCPSSISASKPARSPT